MAEALGVAEDALADKPETESNETESNETESNEEPAKIELATETAKTLRSCEQSFRDITPLDRPRQKPPQVREATVEKEEP